MRTKLTVIKVGGKIVEEEATLQKLLNDFAVIEGPKVLVHGGGRSATKIATQPRTLWQAYKPGALTQ